MTDWRLGLTLLTALAVAALVEAERREHRRAAWIAKPIASLGFVGVALAAGAADSAVGLWILVALVLCVAGDVLLLWRDSARHFIAGLGSFLLGHVAFGVAFAVRGVDSMHAIAALGVLGLPAMVVARWLWPRLRARPAMRGPVLAYIVVITAMVALAWGGHHAGAPPIWLWGAALFYVSDLAVARQRFVVDHFHNRLFGLPAYYAAQIAFAWGVTAV
jgi:uncharacterized membrane protein YhhN